MILPFVPNSSTREVLSAASTILAVADDLIPITTTIKAHDYEELEARLPELERRVENGRSR